MGKRFQNFRVCNGPPSRASHHGSPAKKTTLKGEEENEAPPKRREEKAATTQGAEGKAAATQGRTAAPHLKLKEDTNPKKGGTQPSLGGVAFLCSFLGVAAFFLFLGACRFPPLFFVGCCCVFPPRSFGWRCCSLLSFRVALLSPRGRCGFPSPPFGVVLVPSSSFYVCVHSKLKLWMRFMYVGVRGEAPPHKWKRGGGSATLKKQGEVGTTEPPKIRGGEKDGKKLHSPKGESKESTTTQKEDGRKHPHHPRRRGRTLHHSEGGGKAAPPTRRKRREEGRSPLLVVLFSCPVCGRCCFFPLLLWGGAVLLPFVFGCTALVGADVPSSFGVVWCCLSPGRGEGKGKGKVVVPNASFLWCCIPLLLPSLF